MPSKASPRKPRLVILGGGFGAYRFALGISCQHYDVTLISPRDHFLFTPLLASTTVGTVELRSIIEPLQQIKPGIRFFAASALRIDSNRNVVCCRASDEQGDSDFEWSYDQVVIAVGAISQTFGVPGVAEHALMLKELRDAQSIRERLLQCVERASLPHVSSEERSRRGHVVVVGGGPTGVEFAGELHDFITQDLRPITPELAPYFQITLCEASNQILSSFGQSLGEYTLRTFRDRKITVRTSSLIKEVRRSEVVFADGTSFPCGLVVWSTGVGPTPFVHTSPFAKDERGRLLTDPFLRLRGEENIYAIGDCAAVEERHYPMTAQLAQQQGRYLAHSFHRRARGRSTKPFRYVHLGMLAYIGGHKALADTPGIQWKGFIAWLMWRSIYMTRLVSLKNKVRVLFDWMKASLFGRDTTRI